MMISKEISASPDSAQWQSIEWKSVESHVLKLQMRIAKATRDGKHGKAKALQWLLTHSRSAKLLAVKRVSQNKGSKTQGIDGVIWNTDTRRMKAVNQLSRKAYQAKPLKRIYIPNKNGKLRPLGIPCMIDRAQQALHLLALEPVSESLAYPNSYGFRPRRSTADAIGQCFICLSQKRSAQWVLEGKLLIKPSKSDTLMFLSNLRELIKKHVTLPVNDLIKLINPKLRGWSNYYRHCVAKQVFGYVGHKLFHTLWHWAKRRHPTKSKTWIALKYFIDRKGQWQFHGWQKIMDMDCQFNLFEIAKVPIERHVKIRSAVTPFEPQYQEYLAKRKSKRQARNSWNKPAPTVL